ncbi:hypothetical protein chiPu_0027311 [Chiloscyllium punctatum]|uniref:Uncharacterized protein n=1 Tax=Chiloscyllium punctatum TaxID=137246 RepID=A0A401TLK1_CHIPU|nr:hypothetical protein [Chiloscyllium punctatum]
MGGPLGQSAAALPWLPGVRGALTNRVARGDGEGGEHAPGSVALRAADVTAPTPRVTQRRPGRVRRRFGPSSPRLDSRRSSRLLLSDYTGSPQSRLISSMSSGCIRFQPPVPPTTLALALKSADSPAPETVL